MKTGKTIRRLTAAALCLCMALSVTACGGKGGDKTGTPKDSAGGSAAAMPQITSKDGVVRSQEVVLSDPDFQTDGFQLLEIKDDWMYGFNYSYEGDGLNGYELVRFRTDGSDFKAVTYKPGNDDAEVTAAACRDGVYYLATATYGNSPALDYALEMGEDGMVEGEDYEIPDGLSEDATASYSIACVTEDGDLKWEQEVKAPADSTYFYVDSIAATDNGLLVVSSEGVDRYSDADGSFQETVCAVAPDDLVGMLYAGQNGEVMMTDDSGMGTRILRYDASKKKFTEAVTLPSALVGTTLYTGSAYDLYIASEDGVYGVSLGTDGLTPIVNFVNSDLDLQGTTKVLEAGDGRLALQAYGPDFTQGIYMLEMVAPEDVKDKKEITLGGYYIDYEVRSQVISFNKESDTYRITVQDYSQYDLADDDYDNPTGMSRMNTDIVSGNVPDILVFQPQMPVSSYISKGILTDLTDWYEKDSGIKREDFLQNVVEAFRTDGRMYVAVPGFTVTGVAGKTKYIGDGKDLTIKKAKEIAAGIGIDENKIFGVTDRLSLFRSAIEFSGDEFIDQDAHTCDFNNQAFQDLLAFVKNVPEQVGDDQYEEAYTQYLGDKALLGIQYINSAFDYYYMTRQVFGDVNVTFTGFPSADNQGASIAPSMKIGISSSASDQEGCWQFVRRFLMPEYQDKMESNLPISRTAIRAGGQKIIDELKKQQEEYEEYMRELNDGSEGESYVEEQAPEASAEGAESEALTEATDDMDTSSVEESEDMTGKPVPEEVFNGTHEEYEEYLKDFEADAQASEGDEEEIISGEEAMEEDPAAAQPENALPEFGEADIEAMEKILEGLHFAVNGEDAVVNIILEEAEAYFAGQKSAAEVSDIIQSRVQVFLKENE